MHQFIPFWFQFFKCRGVAKNFDLHVNYRRVGVKVMVNVPVAVTEPRGVTVPVIVALGVRNGSSVGVAVEGGRDGMGAWVGVGGTVPPGNNRNTVAVRMNSGVTFKVSVVGGG